jgi:perosamine synthetase
MSDFIPVNEPMLGGNEKKYLVECIETGWISSEGPFVKKFEDAFSEKVDRKFGIAVANGTAALDIAVKALEIGVGDEVILPTFTIISCIQQIVRSGATPVLVDSDPVTWNMDVTQIEEKITKKTKAIMIVHIYGLPVNMDPVLDLAKKYNLTIIEDAAEMIGQTYKGKLCGSFGDISTFSFYPNKHITTGEGGMVLTNDENLAERCRSLRNLCFKKEQRFVHEELGWNYRMTNLQAALGLAQLEQLERFVDKKRAIGKTYTKLLKGIKGIQLPLEKTNSTENIYWIYGIVLNNEVPFDAKKAMNKLGEMGIGTRPFFWPMHEQPVFKRMGLFEGEFYPVAENLARRGFYIPSGLALNASHQEKVASVILEYLI